ncbi:MAG: TolC family protein [Verrucomicrobiales bacterium]
MIRLFYLTAISILFCTSLSYAQTGGPLRLSDLPDAVKNNPEWKSALYRIEEARGRLVQAGRLANPTIEFEGTHNSAFREGSLGVAFSQAFPMTARLSLEKAVSEREVQMAEAELRDAYRKLLLEAQTVALEYLAITQQIALQVQRRAISEELATFIATAAAAGELPQLDEKQARLEAASAGLQIHQLEAVANRSLAQLRRLLGREPNVELTVDDQLAEPVVGLNSPTGAEAANRPDYQATVLAADAAETEIALEQAKRRDDVTVGVFVEGERAEDAPEGLENDTFGGIRISIPLPIWNKNEGAIQEKRAKAMRLREEASALASSIRSAAAIARADMETNQKLFTEINEQLLPLAQQQVTNLESAYRSGQGNLQAVLRAREQRIQIESARLDALRDFHLARIRLAAAAPSSTISVPSIHSRP